MGTFPYQIRAHLDRLLAVARTQAFDSSTPEGRSKERYRRILLTVSSGLVARVVTTATALVSLPLLLSYLGKDQFGLWSAITSSVLWLGVFDFGLAGGIVNVISEAHGRSDRRAAAHYVSTAWFVLAAIAALMAIVVALAVGRVSWDSAFAVAGSVPESVIRYSVVMAITFVLLGLPLSIVPQIYAGYQRAYVVHVFGAVAAIASLAGVWMGVRLQMGMPMLIVLMSAGGLLAGIASAFLLTSRHAPWLRPRLAFVSTGAIRRLARTSVPLFIFQLGAVMVNQSQLVILAHTINLRAVAEYAVIMRIIQLASGLLTLTTGAFIPSYREAFERRDHGWLRVAFRRMLTLRMLMALVAAFALVGFGNDLVRIWLHRIDMRFSIDVWIALAIFLVATTWVTAHTDFLTIMDRIWVQVGLVLVNGAATVILTIWLSPRYGNVGLLAAIGAVSILGWTWLLPLLTRPLLRAVPSSQGQGREP